MTQPQLEAFDYVNHPYAAVRAALIANPLDLFRRATAPTGDAPELHAKVGPLEVASHIEIEVVSIDEVAAPDGHKRTELAIRWHATHRPGLFPTMTATLSLYPLTPTETQIELAGAYSPPLGAVGKALDATAMRGIAEESVGDLVRDLASYLRTSLA